MDGFDDLLAPSRQALEDNPFEDPFAKRSNSPDPWASFHPQLEPTSETYSDHAYQSTQEQGGSTTPTGSFVTAERDEPVETLSNDADPLDAATRTIDEDNALSSPIQTPGFMESVPPEIPTVRPKQVDVLESLIADPSTVPLPHVVPTPQKHPTRPTASAVFHSPSGSSSISSPLEQPTVSPVTRTFTGLTIGGETVGGWQVAQMPAIIHTLLDMMPKTATMISHFANPRGL